ncbi:MAG: outer membrane beta-barrel protein [Rubricoccaceae bacterium]|nr:outer membrane beta-barrel protein [Rubricoccaceae bacterium]
MRTTFLFVFAASLCFASAAEAQIRFLPYVGYATNQGYDFEASPDDTAPGFLVGVGAETSLTPGLLPVGLKARPSVETAFVSGGEVVPGTETSTSTLRAGLDLIVDFSPPLSSFGVYAGAGVAYMSYKATAEGFDDLTGSAVGASVLAGARFGGGFVAPFVQGRYTVGAPTPDDFSVELENSIAVQAGASIGL